MAALTAYLTGHFAEAEHVDRTLEILCGTASALFQGIVCCGI